MFVPTLGKIACVPRLTSATTESIDLGIRDEKGRAVGYRVERLEVDYIPAPEGAYAYYHRVPGHFYAANVHPTRDGVRFGACVPTFEAPTVEAREAGIRQRIAAGSKRYSKKYAAK